LKAKKILKFGGSSLSGGRGIKGAAEIILNESRKTATGIVVSAMAGVTDSLIASAMEAEGGNDRYRDLIESLRGRHVNAIRDLFPPKDQANVITHMQIMINELEEILHGIELVKECSPRTMDLVMSFGERMICTIMSQYLLSTGLDVVPIDAREIIVTDNNFGNASVNFAESFGRIREKISPLKGIPVVTGFIASTKDGVTTTLGRTGSDYTASILGAAMDAEFIEMWTDFDGVMSADPKHVEGSFVIQELTYKEAMELSYFGAHFMHPYTMIPAVEKNIPITIKNFFHPENPGTRISGEVSQRRRPVTGIASIDQIALVNVEGGGMIGIPGIAARIFGALAKERVNIIMISQASSEHSICLGIKQHEAQKVIKALEVELTHEIQTKRIEKFDMMPDLVIIAIIGENMRGTPGISGKLFSALGKSAINILAIAQGSSERNISLVVDKEEEGNALRTIHRAFLSGATG
jgi:aspartokinase/homoserine dehydrogenase 1